MTEKDAKTRWLEALSEENVKAFSQAEHDIATAAHKIIREAGTEELGQTCAWYGLITCLLAVEQMIPEQLLYIFRETFKSMALGTGRRN